MIQEITIQEFKHKTLMRLLLDKLSIRGKVREEYRYEELISNAAFATNELLRDLGLDDVWARKRGQRIFLMHEQYRRIICEVGVVAEKRANGLYARPEIVLVNLRGIIPENRKLQDLIETVAKLGYRNNFKRKENQ